MATLSTTALGLVALALAVPACSGNEDEQTRAAAPAPSASPSASSPPVTAARALLSGTGGSRMQGTVRFTDAGEEVRVDVTLAGAPTGEHPLAVAAGQTCSGSGATRLTSVSVGPGGIGTMSFTTKAVRLVKGEGYVRGKMVVLGPPDKPLACGMVLAVGRWSES